MKKVECFLKVETTIGGKVTGQVGGWLAELPVHVLLPQSERLGLNALVKRNLEYKI